MRGPAWGERGAEARQWLSAADRELLPAALADAKAALAPADCDTLIAGFTAALALVAGVGMSRDERKSWFTSATAACKHLPEDLFRDGVNAARRTADHPSKVVPAITAHVEDGLRRRRRDLANVQALMDCGQLMPWETEQPRFNPATAPTPEQIEEIKASVGLRASDETLHVERHTGPAREPTVDDYVGLGLTRAAAQDAVAQRDREKAAAKTAPRSATPPGYRAVAQMLAVRINLRRDGQDVRHCSEVIKQSIEKHGRPPLSWLIAEVRRSLVERRRLDQAA